ncbi:nucleotidyltransferase AbiEii toxin of type IV toxin-antitoxin system [Arcticibacter pallidicorallinus]|uniref:Nucleotidyltransferase AbiEii toxin of type IV toxin-antitoxin system n=1 Tax=Arcticibacter pallidicorallinus TaxID=1259464 RepID=A0A2T0U483_9SPHI|nr:nucleotidyl transferase AbiEii/AbiGii toxin family protein [Arcticibacter pallidicorallinus]PRY52723.1 nucleotidyltransferase AbiEii toxin of type IV toxin-antitoxin system [Arcticibacter pallidicorallinus]
MIAWLQNTAERQRELLGLTSSRSGLPAGAIEKDWWVTLALKAIFQTPWSDAMVFKGGTSLSKSWGLIDRFSEDIDLVLDRAVLGYPGDLSKTKIKTLRRDSCAFISGEFRKNLEEQFLAIGIPTELFSLTVKETTEHDRDPQVLVLNYASVLDKDPYLREAVLIEIGARSLREPSEQREVGSLIGQTLKNNEVAGSPFSILTVTPPRTFLEKIFLLHEEFSKAEEKVRSERMSRHLYDIERIMRTDYAEQALSDKELYHSIIAHREKFNALRGLDYSGHQPATIRFLPSGETLKDWENDYKAMRESMFYGESLSFSELMHRLHVLQKRINKLSYSR